jgi:hypothetical protein
MEERYNVYFAGQVIDGHDPANVREKLAKVFKANESMLDKLFSGKPQLVKRDCDSNTASKYKQALEGAGAVPIIKLASATEAAQPPTANTEPTRPMSAAERIAALAAAPDHASYPKVPVATASTAAAAAQQENVADSSGIALTPPGTEVLRKEERAQPVIREVDTSSLEIDAAAQRLSEEPPAPPPAPDTQHLSMGDVGETIPNLASSATPLVPDLAGIALSEPGTDFSDCAQPEPQAAAVNLSHLAALPPGDMPVEEQQRRPMPVAAPSTDHISLKD